MQLKRQGGAPEGSGRVDNVQGAMAKAGLSVSAPLWLLFVAVACWVACPCAVPISLHHHTASLSQTCPNSFHAQNGLSAALMFRVHSRVPLLVCSHNLRQ